MNNYRIRPKGNYIQEASWHELYVLTKKWKEDVEFQKKDIKFIIDLVETYFAKLLMYKNLEELHETQVGLLHLYNECTSSLLHIHLHLSCLSNLIEDPNSYDAYIFRNEQEQLEDKISVLIKNIKRTRKDAFALTTDVVKNENPKIFWRYN
tara:strand:+ start:495 stop:947 length:453 start_codon:yes stop_codon:yes gene_type:complete